MGLLDFIKKLPTLNELTGSFGEWLAKMYAKTLPGALVLHDVLINGADGYTSQIDLVLIGNRGIYVVEVKMYACYGMDFIGNRKELSILQKERLTKDVRYQDRKEVAPN